MSANNSRPSATRKIPAPKRKQPARDDTGRRSAPGDDDIIKSLQGTSGAVSEDDLRSIFGDDLADVRGLAIEHRVQTRAMKRGKKPRVYLLPGIMGSELGFDRHLIDDVIWLGLFDVLMGRLRKLRLGAGADARITSLGFLPGVYVPMRLELERAGYDVVKVHFDWRQDITKLGARLKAEIAKEKSKVMIVAHSMGGLVARAAFKLGMKNVSRFVMLAVPNKGSLSPVEAFRGHHGLARIISNVDLVNDATELAEQVFSTFPGLHQMILHKTVNENGLDLMDISKWPVKGSRPKENLLKLASKLQDHLALPHEAADAEWFLIAGAQRVTKVAARVENDRLSYKISDEGDGTVPLESAVLPGVSKTWYGSADHPFFTGNKAVRAATVEILKAGETRELPSTPPEPAVPATWVSEEDVRRVAAVRHRAIGGAGTLSQHERLRIIFGASEALVLPEKKAAPSSATGRTHDFENVVIGRKKQRRLEICLYNGSITDVNARAYVMGTFPGVTPTGAARSLDELMGGAIREITSQNMFRSGTGEIFILPLARRMVRAETAVFVGLGAFDAFKAQDVPQRDGTGTNAFIHGRHVAPLEIAAENVAHTLSRTYLEEFATVLLGGTVSGDDPLATCESLLRGFLRGLDLSDSGQRMRRVTICETDQKRYNEVRQHFITLATSPLCDGIEVVISDMPPPPEVARLRALGVSSISPHQGDPDPAYLMVRSDPPPGGDAASVALRYTILGPSYRATIREPLPLVLPRTEFAKMLAPVAGDRVPTTNEIDKMGDDIAERLLPKEIRDDLKEFADLPLVLLHDSGVAAMVPWETMRLSSKLPPALAPGMTRRFIAPATECMRWSAPNTIGRKVRVLLISNPTGDLDGAAEEARTIKLKLASNPRFELDDSLSEGAATREAIIGKLERGNFDIVHYSGHASFDRFNPARCGLLCAKDRELTGPDLVRIPRLPFLMVVNACQSGRTRMKSRTRGFKPSKPTPHTAPGRSIAETMLCAGISNFIGTYWPVGDDTASAFATQLYTSLLSNETLGKALRAGRNAIKDREDWPNYLLYGNPAARLDPTQHMAEQR